MAARQKELAEIKLYIEGINKEVTMILQSLQWDRKHLIESTPMVSCDYDSCHRVPPDKKEKHERECSLRSQGYMHKDKLLPEPFDPSADTVVKFSKEDIMKIIDNASKNDSMFKKGCPEAAPLTLERLQAAYTPDERRALHDAAVSAAPACHDLTDLALISSTDGNNTSKPKSRMEVLAELRDMRRRRVKYRVSGAAGTRNYSHVLRDVIRTQMEVYAATQGAETAASQAQKDVNGDQIHATKDAQHNYDENRDRFRDNKRYTDTYISDKTDRKRYDKFSETDQSREHKNTRGSHKPGHNKHNDRHEFYCKDNKYNRDYGRHSRKEKEKHSQSKDRGKRDDRYEKKVVVKEELDKEGRMYRDNNGCIRDKYSRNHKSIYFEEGSSTSSKSQKRHTFENYDYEDRECRPRDDRKRKRKEGSEKCSESQYKRYYDTVDVKQEIDSS